jgi:hypothetical protein
VTKLYPDLIGEEILQKYKENGYIWIKDVEMSPDCYIPWLTRCCRFLVRTGL